MLQRAEVIARLTSAGEFEIVEDASGEYPLKIYRNAPPSLRALLESTRRFDNRTFFIYDDEEICFAEHFS